MAKKSGPNPAPKVGEKVDFYPPVPFAYPPAVAGKITKIVEGTDDRVVHVEVITEKGPVIYRDVPFSDPEDEISNTWFRADK